MRVTPSPPVLPDWGTATGRQRLCGCQSGGPLEPSGGLRWVRRRPVSGHVSSGPCACDVLRLHSGDVATVRMTSRARRGRDLFDAHGERHKPAPTPVGHCGGGDPSCAASIRRAGFEVSGGHRRHCPGGRTPVVAASL